MSDILKSTKRNFACIGSVYELALKEENCTIDIKNESGVKINSINSKCIKGNVAIKTKDGIHTFDVYFNQHNSDGNVNQRWTMAQAMLAWTPQINGNGTPATIVNINGMIDGNDYVRKDGELTYTLRWRTMQANTKLPENPKMSCSLTGVFYVNKIVEEQDRKQNLTGRLAVELLSVNNKGEVFPVNVIVPDDLASDFQDIYPVKSSAYMEFNVIMKHIGGQTNEKLSFGHKADQDTSNNYDIKEIILVGANDPYEEPEEQYTEDENGNQIEVPTQWINPKVVQKALKERAAYLERLKADGHKTSNTKSFDQTVKRANNKINSVQMSNDFEDDDPNSIF